MARRSVTFDVKVNTPSAEREATRVANIFSSKLNNISVGTRAGSGGGGGGSGGGGGGGGRGGVTSGMPGSSIGNLIFGSAQFAFAGMFYKFFSDLPGKVIAMDQLATANKRAATSFAVLAGSTKNASDMTDAYQRGSGGIAARAEATTSAMRLFNLGLASNSEQMQKFTTLARGMSQALGKDVGYVEEQFTLAMANQSYLRFDQLGLSVERQKQLMAELAKQYPEMTREVQFQNAMLQQAAEKYYNLANAQEALGTSTEVATRMLKDQGDALAEIVAREITQPLAGDLAKFFGGTDYNLSAPSNRAYANRQRRNAANVDAWWMEPAYYLEGTTRPGSEASFKQEDRVRLLGQADMADALAKAQDRMQAASIMNIKIDPAWVSTLDQAQDALGKVGTNTDVWRGRINAVSTLIQIASGEIDGFGDSMFDMGDATEYAQAQLEDLTNSLYGSASGMIEKLVREGATSEQIAAMGLTVENMDQIAADAEKTSLYHGTVLQKAEAYARANEEATSAGQEWLDAKAESERQSKKAMSDMESSAKKAATAMEGAADALLNTYKDMLHKIPGLFGTSEVNEDDLYLASQGLPVNYADDPLRRLADVALNKTKRDDVDMGEWARALHLPEGTDPKALYILAKRAWESGELFANPENIGKFVNQQAVRGDLMGQEFGALGQQALEAMFGAGTQQGNDYLRVFGVKALDPIQAGLITEITTKGPIMGQKIAEAMHAGFEQEVQRLPWIEALMKTIMGQVGKGVAQEMNSNASSDLAASESVNYTYTTPAGVGVLH